MAKGLTAGDSVRIVQRDQTPADLKSGLFYPHYSGMTGVIGKIYTDQTAAVTVDPESLPTTIRTRHEASTQTMRQKWLDGLSEEARNRLSSAEKKLTLRYSILVSLDDLGIDKSSALAAVGSVKKVPAAVVSAAATSASPISESHTLTLEELDAREAAYLAEIARKKNIGPGQS